MILTITEYDSDLPRMGDQRYIAILKIPTDSGGSVTLWHNGRSSCSLRADTSRIPTMLEIDQAVVIDQTEKRVYGCPSVDEAIIFCSLQWAPTNVDDVDGDRLRVLVEQLTNESIAPK